ncbi:MAG: DUF1501 domain-containing protein [Verrucomicrobiales bacterium]|nr:DUF1501 domain-containing protein [Verrucomicrobiales bacterium]
MNVLPSRKSASPLSRRRFLSQVGCGAMGWTGMVNTLAHLKLMQGALNAQGSGGGYKALVCVFLGGGNDSNNLLIPATGTARTHYDGISGNANAPGRGTLRIPVANLQALATNPAHIAAANPVSGYLGTFGIHPQLAGMKDMFNAGELAFVANVGTLTRPGITRANYATFSKPPQLFSHSDQVTQWQSSVPDRPFTSGWGGRVADYLDPLSNPSSGNASMSISIAGVNSFQVSATGAVVPYVMTSSGVVSLGGYALGTSPYGNAVNNPSVLFDQANYKNNDPGMRLKAFERILQHTNDSLMENAYNSVMMSARLTEGMVGEALAVTANGTASTLDSHFNNAFSGAEAGVSVNNTFTNQMKLVARLIAGNAALGNTRQIFFVQQTGYDTHTTQIPDTGNTFAGGHTGLMNVLSRTLKGFRDALQDPTVNQWGNTVAFSASDFTRTFTANKTDASAGSDHAWGGHHFVMGGPVRGGRIYGKFPVLLTGTTTNSIDSTGSSGRWIPSTSVDQYSAVLASWLGVPVDAIGDIFPNLSRFSAAPFSDILLPDQSPNLGFLQLG